MTRRALWFVGPGRLEVREEPLAEPGPGQVLVRTLATGISAGTELLIYRGQAPADLAADATLPALQGSLRFPLRYGYSAVGQVAALGAGVGADWLGRRVFAFQPHASAFLARPDEVMPLPTGLDAEAAVLLPNLETAVNLLLDGAPLVGEQVAVFGQGIVGLLVTALLARLPLASLVTLDRHPRRRALSAELGAHAGLDPAAPDAAEQLAAALRGPGEASGADLVYELSGQPAALDQALAAAGFAARIVVGSWYGTKRADLDLGSRFHRGRLRLVSSQVSTIAPELSGRWTTRRRLRTALGLLPGVQPARFLTHRYPLERAAEAYALLDQRPADALQVVLTY